MWIVGLTAVCSLKTSLPQTHIIAEDTDCHEGTECKLTVLRTSHAYNTNTPRSYVAGTIQPAWDRVKQIKQFHLLPTLFP